MDYSKARSEALEQEALVYWLRMQRITYFMVGNENPYSSALRSCCKQQARGLIARLEAKAKKMGKVNGAPDLVIILPKGRVIFLELKKTKGGRQSESQKRFEQEVKELGHDYFLARGAEEAVNYITQKLKED